MSLAESLHRAKANRQPLLSLLAAEQTDCYRLFHGVAEGRPGLAIDRYGKTLLGQLWGDPLDAEELEAVEDAMGPVIWRQRGSSQAPTKPSRCRERDLSFAFQAIHDGIDPWLFLDLRAGRRKLVQLVKERPDCAVLNTFSYTATAGVMAAAAGARRVVNVDHARQWTRIGRENARENDVQMTFLQVDYFAAVRQMAGLKVGRKGRKLPRVVRERFDVVLLDPPTLAKGPFGAVDIVNDYASLFKPAWLTLNEDGALLATNHSARVSLDDWLEACRRCAAKAGRPVRDIEVVEGDADFPSFDSAPPLKVAVFR
ncbi:MAG TPA: SAM-dependent methyltransferase [Deltaproteobacteria bacterium]|nr:SAM-dependent methyltransferase [Deltaproteobacteria bacterium]